MAPKAARPVTILGIFVADTAYTAARLPNIGEALGGSGFAVGPGGKGSNQAVAAARAGADVHFISRLGDDEFGVEKASVGNLKQTFTSRGLEYDFTSPHFAGDYLLGKATQVKNVWIPYGA